MYIGRNLDEDWKDLPVSLAMSMGIHESQSLLWERMVHICIYTYLLLTNTYIYIINKHNLYVLLSIF